MTSKDVFDDTKRVQTKSDLTHIICSTCYKFVLEPIIAYFANSSDRKLGAETSVMTHVKRYREGQQLYLFVFKAITHKEPTAEASNTDRPLTGIHFVDED